jgi:prolyl-tRNA editing enzyme YbaK/EbsC (Cys-tRNA(Pro) deacylase)/ubiquinone/menaquinone biosynthesis C-methylase UbiE
MLIGQVAKAHSVSPGFEQGAAQGYFDKVAANYDTLYLDPTSLAENQIVCDHLKELLRSIPHQKVRVLDIGCGTGLVCDMLLKNIGPLRTLDYIGIDISEQMLKQFSKNIQVKAESNHQIKSLAVDANRVRPASFTEPFDLIVSTFGSFSYIDDIGNYLREARCALRDSFSGVVVMTYSRLSNRNMEMAEKTGDGRWLDSRRPYAYRHDDTSLDYAPQAYFYTADEMLSAAQIGGFGSAKILGINADRVDSQDPATTEEAKVLLVKEMQTMENVNVAHSLLLIGTPGRAAHRHIDDMLVAEGALIERIAHDPVTTVEEADRVCPEPSAGLKSILLNVAGDDKPLLAVLPGHSRLDMKALKALTRGRCSWFNREAACALLDCDVGAVPPITKADVKIIADPSIFDRSIVYFNPGVNTLTYGIKSGLLREILERRGARFASIAQ